MIHLCRPDLSLASVRELTPEFLAAHGLDGLVFDADNTLVPRSRYEPTPEVATWLETLRAAGTRLCILSNSRHIGKVARMGEALGMPAISLARKPARSGFRRALALLGTAPAATAMVGDQVFTDILGGNLAGLTTILVPSLGARDFVLYRPMRRLERRLLRRWGIEPRAESG